MIFVKTHILGRDIHKIYNRVMPVELKYKYIILELNSYYYHNPVVFLKLKSSNP
jgi:hypothetical protein